MEFLEWASPENLVTLGMAADAADESLLLVRHFDSEDHDISELQSAAASYLSRIRYLFQEGNVQHTTGFTELILRWLSATHGFMVEQRPKCIGGPDVIHQGLIDSCLRPFQLFVRLAAETVKAEYPSYALISAFQVFSLTAAGAQSELDEERGVEAALTRLAQALGLDSQGLIEQFLDHPAHRHARSSSYTVHCFSCLDGGCPTHERSAGQHTPPPPERPAEGCPHPPQRLERRHYKRRGTTLQQGSAVLDPSSQPPIRGERVGRTEGDE